MIYCRARDEWYCSAADYEEEIERLRLQLEGVTLLISNSVWFRNNIPFYWDPCLGWRLPTSGVQWDVRRFISELLRIYWIPNGWAK